MSKQLKFKQSQVYGWDEEPVDARPSEFAPSTNYATLSGYQSSFMGHQRPLRRRKTNRFGIASVLASTMLILMLGGWAIVTFAPMLRH